MRGHGLQPLAAIVQNEVAAGRLRDVRKAA